MSSRSWRWSRTHCGTGWPAVWGEADLGAEPVDQPPQRRSDVGVGRADAGVVGEFRGRAVERCVGRATQQPNGVLQEGRTGAGSGVDTGDDVTGRRSVGPLDAEGGRGPAEFRDRTAVGIRQRS